MNDAIKRAMDSMGDCVWLDTGLAKSLKAIKGSIASWLVQYSDDTYIVDVGNLGKISSSLGIKKSTVSMNLSWLRKNGFIKSIDNLSPGEAKDLLCQKDATNFWGCESTSRCEWCRSLALRLHGHHYPVPKSMGGDKVVYICPNCHDEFHYLINRMRYQLLPKLLDLRTISDEMMEEIRNER